MDPALDAGSSGDGEKDSVARICEAVCEWAQELLVAEGACVARYDPLEDELCAFVCTGMLGPVRGTRFPLEDSVSGTALQSGQAYVDNDVPHSRTGAYARALEVGVRRALAVPLRGWDRTMGTLVVVNGGSEQGFTRRDADLLEGYAVPAALALTGAERSQMERRRAEEEARRRRERDVLVEQLRRLHEAEMALASEESLAEVLTSIVETSKQLTRADTAVLGLLDESGREFETFVSAGLELSDAGKVWSSGGGGASIIEKILEEGRPVCLRAEQDLPCSCCDPPGDVSPHTFVGVPVIVEGSVFGMLYLANHGRSDALSQQDELLVQMFAAQASAMIRKARTRSEHMRTIASLEVSRALRSRMSAYVSHDIRNALQGVSMWAERLNEQAAQAQDPVLVEMAAKIDRGAEHALRLVRDVLDLSMLEDGRLQTWLRSFRLVDLLGSAVEAVTPDAERGGIDVRIECRATLCLVADPDRTRQVVVNLLGNAIKFSDGPQRVDVVARERAQGPSGQDSEWVTIAVRDRGPGIAPEDVDRIFAPYERGSGGDWRREGSGLGLTLSRYLAEHMGGALTVETSPGLGSEFTLWLPANLEPESRSGWIG